MITVAAPRFEDTIVASNVGPAAAPATSAAAMRWVSIGSYDLVGSGGTGGISSGNGNIVLSGSENPGLATLGNYGGPSETIPLLPGSVALGAGVAIPGVSTDQRGVPLPSGSIDIGAFQSHGFTVKVVAGSTPQVGAVGAAFAVPLAIVATPNDPIEPVAGGVVDFTVNPASNGASATLSAESAVIGFNGVAQVTAVANSIVGAYTVTAAASGFTSTDTFSLKNLLPLTFSGIASQSITWGTSTATFSGNLADGAQAPRERTSR